MSKRPDCSKIVKSELQLKNQNRFTKAVKYASFVLKDPELYGYYKKKKRKNQSVWNAAISDYMSKPKVKSVNLNGYEGVPGNQIGISVWDKWQVKGVSIVIMNKDGREIERGDAVAKDFSGGMEWNYLVTAMNTDYKSSIIIAKVSDMPGNTVEEISQR